MKSLELTDEKALSKWRRRLAKTDTRRDIGKVAVDMLCADAKTLVHFYFSSPQIHGESAVRKQLVRLANGLERSSKALTKLSPQGVVRVYAAAGLSGDADAVEDYLVSGKLFIVARWAREASRIKLGGVTKQGRVPDVLLRRVVFQLAELFESRLGLKAAHTTNPSGKAVSIFNEFLNASFADFSPNEAAVSPRQLNSAALAAVRSLRVRP